MSLQGARPQGLSSEPGSSQGSHAVPPAWAGPLQELEEEIRKDFEQLSLRLDNAEDEHAASQASHARDMQAINQALKTLQDGQDKMFASLETYAALVLQGKGAQPGPTQSDTHGLEKPDTHGLETAI